MRKRLGICCILLGVGCLLASVGLIVYNRWEEENAQKASQNILQDVQESILDHTPEESTSEESNLEDSDRDEFEEISVDIPQEMLTTQVNGYDSIGVLSIPVFLLSFYILF